jgi:carboxylesterase
MSAAPASVYVDTSPFDLRPAESGGAEWGAALCLHGLTGTPYEVRPLAEAIAARGIRARGPALPGHNSTPQALALLSRDAWITAVADEYERLREQHECVFLVGLSLGALLSLELAAREHVDALVSIGAPVWFRQPLPLLIPLLKRLHPMISKREGSDIQDPDARMRHPGYSEMPLASVHELIRIQRVVRATLSRITAPILVAHGAHDVTANPRDARRIYERVASTEKELALYEASGHVVTVDRDGADLADRVAEFLACRR